MKKTINIVYLFILSIVPLFGQEKSQTAGGIEFKELSLSQALELAKKENKNLFIDCYTVWCGPCKVLSTKIFPLKEVGDFYNQNFINLKVDCEKGEGPAIAKKFEVSSYPSLVFVNKNGEMFYKATGAKNAEDFIGIGKMALDPKTHLSNIRDNYEKSNKTIDDLLELAKKISENGNWSEAVKTTEDYFVSMNEDTRLSARGWEALSKYFSGYKSPMFEYILNHKKQYNQIVGEETVENHIYNTLSNVRSILYVENEGRQSANTAAKEKQKDEFVQWLGLMREFVDETYYTNRINYFFYMDQPEHYEYAQKFLETEYKTNPEKDKLAYFCAWMANSYKDETGKKLESALLWAKKGMALAPESYHGFIVYGHLLSGRNDKKGALDLYLKAKELKEKGKPESIIITQKFGADKLDELIKSMQ